MDLGNDSIVITTDSIVKFANGAYYVADHGGNAGAADVPYTVGYKTFNGSPYYVLTLQLSTLRLLSL